MFYLERNDKMQKKIKTTTLVSLSAVALMALNAEQASADELRAKADSPKQQQVAKAVDHKASTASDKTKPKIELKADPKAESKAESKTNKSVIDSSEARTDTAKKAIVSDTATDKSQDKAVAKKQDAKKENKASVGQDRSSDEQYLTHGWDPELLKAVMNQAGITTTSMGHPCISKADAEKITDLYLGNQAIHNLNGIENLTNLKSLDLSNNGELKSLKPIGNLINLNTLDISNNHEVRDLSSVISLPNIVSLKMNNIVDIHNSDSITAESFQTQINKIKSSNLDSLELEGNELTDIDFINQCLNIRLLNISNNNVMNIKPLEYLKELKWLYANGNKIQDIDSLKNLINLQTLDLGYNKISNIKNLPKGLVELNLKHNCITDIRPLKDLKILSDHIDLTNQIYVMKLNSETTDLTKYIKSSADIKYENNGTIIDDGILHSKDVIFQGSSLSTDAVTWSSTIHLDEANIGFDTVFSGIFWIVYNMTSIEPKITYSADPDMRFDATTYDSETIRKRSGLIVNGIKLRDPIDVTFHVGNIEFVDNPDGSKTVRKYEVDETTGKFRNSTVLGIIGQKIKKIKQAGLYYVADATIPYTERRTITAPKDGCYWLINTDTVEHGRIKKVNQK